MRAGSRRILVRLSQGFDTYDGQLLPTDVEESTDLADANPVVVVRLIDAPHAPPREYEKRTERPGIEDSVQ